MSTGFFCERQLQRTPLPIPNLIIGGTNKAGTTSVFRYLAAHPQACASSVKETRFFSHHPNPLSPDALTAYAAYFRHCRGDCSTIFEASPQYLAGGLTVASKLNSVIPELRLVFILRDPSERLMSFYNSDLAWDSATVRDLAVREFVDKVLKTSEIPGDLLDARDAQLQRELYRGRYHPMLVEYLSVFAPGKLLVLFFEELTSDPRSVMCKLSDFAGIDADFYRNFTFTVENKSRRYRSTTLNRAVHSLNLFMEPALNHVPWLRAVLRRIYTGLNETEQEQPRDAFAVARLNEYYQRDNRELGEMLKRIWPLIYLPRWVAP